MGLNHDWQFRKIRAPRHWLAGKEEGAYGHVDLPHSWNDRDTFQMGIRYHQGHGSYRKSFMLPAGIARNPDILWRLQSEGFYGTGDLWVNGKRTAEVDGQYRRIQPAAEDGTVARHEKLYRPPIEQPVSPLRFTR